MTKMTLYLRTTEGMGRVVQRLESRADSGVPLPDLAPHKVGDQGMPLDELLRRIQAMARMSPTELAERMDSEEGSQIADFDSEEIDPDSLVRDWDQIGRATPRALEEAQYQAFLQGLHPSEATTELYGGDLQEA